MHNAFSRIFSFLIILLTFNLILFGGISTIMARSVIHNIIEREEESDIRKIQMVFKSINDSWTLDSLTEEQFQFFIDNMLAVVSCIKIYDKDYNLLMEKGVMPPLPNGNRSGNQQKELHPIGIEDIEQAYVEVFSSADKLIQRQTVLQRVKQGSYILLVILVITFPIMLVVAYWGSKQLTANIKRVSDTISQLAEGKRDIVFPKVRTEESLQILQAAENLQEQLIRKDERAIHRLQELTHDLKGPIAGLYNQLEAVELGAMELSEERFAHLYRELGYLNQLIDDMSVLYKLEDNLGKLNCISLHTEDDLITPLMERFNPMADEKGIIIYSDIERKSIWGDSILLKRGISNLIQNAILYGSGLVIDISVFTDEESGADTIEVRNKGQISDEDLPHLFTRYWRKTQDRGGSGLGLSITRMIARKHGGDLTVRNQNPDQVVFSLKIKSLQK